MRSCPALHGSGLGELLAVGCALAWAGGIILFKRTESVSPAGMNLFKNVLAAALLAATLPIVGGGVDLERSPEDWLRLIVSGVLGIAVADTLFFVGLKRVGAGMVAILSCVYAPLVVALSVVLLHEPLRAPFAGGAALVAAGVFVAVWPAAGGLRPAQRAVDAASIVIIVGSVSLTALGIVIAKPALDHGDLVEVTWIRLLAGIVGQVLWLAPSRARREAFGVLRPQRAWRSLGPAALLGTYVSMLLWLGGSKYTYASVAAVLNQLATAFTLVLAWLVLGERSSPRRWAGGLTSMVGAAIILAL